MHRASRDTLSPARANATRYVHALLGALLALVACSCADEHADPCAAKPCYPGVSCTATGSAADAFLCGVCPAGYEGDGTTCTKSVEACSPNPCKNGGTCTELTSGFSCACTTDWGGPTCEACAPTQGGVEVCDGLDNNCDGQSDEGLTIACGGADPNGCGPNHDQACPLGAAQGQCRPGTRACEPSSSKPGNPVWSSTCVGNTEPSAEVCDGLDNNCDGEPDEPFNLLSNAANCGGCGNDCATDAGLWADFGGHFPPHAAQIGCTAGACVVTGCQGWWSDDPTTAHHDCTVPPGCDGPLVFADPNLEAKVREAIAKPTGDVLFADVADLQSLVAEDAGIGSLSGVECLTSLTRLQLGKNQISDLSALSGLTSLTVLDLVNNQISDVSALSALTSLTSLYLYSNQISDVSALSALTSLTVLDMANNQISDVSALSALTSLTDLYLNLNQISIISPLVSNTGLDSGDKVYLKSNALPCSDPQTQADIAALVARGVVLSIDCP